jgi:hypothetical protein
VFRRTVNGEVLEFNTTGLLRFSNLVMFDLQTESWWQEFSGEAVVGIFTGTRLELLPMNIVPWEEFRAAFPNGKVLSRDTGHRRPYGYNPYTGYDVSSRPFAYEGPYDERLPAIERVVGIEVGQESLAVPYTVLAREPIVHYTLSGQDLVVFYQQGTISVLHMPKIVEGRDVGAVGVFDPNLEGQQLTFKLENGSIVDEQTGSKWNLLGRAESGPLKGKTLRTLVHHAGQFWFSWVAYKPDTEVYRSGS